VLKNLGVAIAKSMVIVKDKTLIRGDYLLDNRVVVSGLYAPSWKHILYSQGYNSDVQEKKFSWEMGIDELVKLMV